MQGMHHLNLSQDGPTIEAAYRKVLSLPLESVEKIRQREMRRELVVKELNGFIPKDLIDIVHRFCLSYLIFLHV